MIGVVVVGRIGVVGVEWVKGCILCWRKRMILMLVLVFNGLWLKEIVFGEFRGGL